MDELGTKDNPFTKEIEIWQYAGKKEAGTNQLKYIYVSKHIHINAHLNIELTSKKIIAIFV